MTNNGEISHSSTFTGSHRRTVESKEDYVPPPNPYITEEEPPSPEVPKPPSCTEAWLDPGTVLIDCFEEVVGREKVDQAEIIGVKMSNGEHIMSVIYSIFSSCSALFLCWMVPSLPEISSQASEVSFSPVTCCCDILAEECLLSFCRFYHHLKQHGKSFEIIYISSD